MHVPLYGQPHHRTRGCEAVDDNPARALVSSTTLMPGLISISHKVFIRSSFLELNGSMRAMAAGDTPVAGRAGREDGEGHSEGAARPHHPHHPLQVSVPGPTIHLPSTLTTLTIHYNEWRRESTAPSLPSQHEHCRRKEYVPRSPNQTCTSRHTF